jgi:hypothetical protein
MSRDANLQWPAEVTGRAGGLQPAGEGPPRALSASRRLVMHGRYQRGDGEDVR